MVKATKMKNFDDKTINNKLYEVLDKISEISSLNFNTTLQPLGDDGIIDAVIVGLNMLSEELEHTVVSRLQLEKSEQEFRSLFEQYHEGIAFISLDGTINKCNQRYADIYDTTAEAMLKKIF